MLPRTLLLNLGPILSTTHAFTLLVSSYNAPNDTLGSVQTLVGDDCTGDLNLTSSNQECGALPSWLELSADRSTVTCVNEADPGSLTLFNINDSGEVKKISNTSALGGPVSAAYYNNGTGLAIAHFTPPSISTFNLLPNSTLQPLQTFTFNLSSIDPERQTTSHVHQALLDPSGQYLLFPDLGADRVHVYCVDSTTNKLEEKQPLLSKQGYGPRHAVFWTAKEGYGAGNATGEENKVYLFVVHELSNKIVSYSVTYTPTGDLAFEEVDEVSTFGNQTTPPKAAAAEIVISPDESFLLASNRLAPIFSLPNPDANNSTLLPSDSLVTFKPARDGKLEFVNLAPSGGLTPRHFSLNKDGTMVAVANQLDGTVVVYARDVETGVIGEEVAAARGLLGGLTNVQWLKE
ncbi:3-carboxymuconate cyclase [Phaeosphaeria sp. MPI-PUGE-AT-0046c]|nr:3-carboxymuconate cyclase [Phaeosphaeria sp. MPI-PUGE-AT-0046c]